MNVTLHFEVDGAQIEVAASIGLDKNGKLLAYSHRDCSKRVWAKKNIEDLNDTGNYIMSNIKHQLAFYSEETEKNSLVDNESDESIAHNKVPDDFKIDWQALLDAAGSMIDTDTTPKLNDEESNDYSNSTLKKIVNNFYGRYNHCEDIVKRIQNSLKDVEDDLKQHTEESLNGIISEMEKLRDDVNTVKESIFGIEDYIIHNCDDSDDEDEDFDYEVEDEDEELEESDTNSDFDEYLSDLKEKLNTLQVSIHDDSPEDPKPVSSVDDEKDQCAKGMTFENDVTLMNINGVYYLHNFYKNTTLMSVDEEHWVVCREKNIPEQYKNFINQKYLIDICTFVSGFGYWISIADPINSETTLPVHISTMNKLLEEIFKITYNLTTETLGYRYISMSKPELINYIHAIIFDNPKTNSYFKVLNTSYNDAQKIRKGENPDSPEIVFCSRYGGPHWKDDFVDLDALARNVENFVIQFSRYTTE